MILAPISVGELFDKITILRVKAERIGDPEKLRNVRKELDLLEAIARDNRLNRPDLDPLIGELQTVNAELWDIEDGKRACERRKTFDAGFIELARSVYIKNDRRAAIKRAINEVSGSEIVEEKSYPSYR